MAGIVQYLGQCLGQVKDSVTGFYYNHETGCKAAAVGVAVAGVMAVSGKVRTVVNITLRYTAGAAVIAGLAMAAIQAFGQDGLVTQLNQIIEAGKTFIKSKMPVDVLTVADGVLAVPALTAISIGALFFQLAGMVR